MINFLTTLGGATTATGTAAETPAEGETPFAGLLALLAGGEGVEAEGDGEEPSGLADLLAGAEAALADPDLSEEEIAAILGPVIAQIGAMLAAEPELLEKADALVAALTETLGVEDAGAEPSWRDLSEGLADLQALLGGAEEVDGDGVELVSLLRRVIEAADVVARPYAPVVTPMVAPVTASAEQILKAPLREASPETGSADVEIEDAPVREGQRVLGGEAETGADFSGQGENEGAEPAVPATRVEARPSVGFTPVTSAALPQAGDAPSQPPNPQPQATPLGPVSTTPMVASTVAASQVASTTPQIAVQGQEILGQIRASTSAEGKINVELKPEGLGKVEISLTPDEAGRLQVVVRADQAAVLSALRADRDGLAAMLRDAGHAVEDSALSFSDLGTQGGNQGDQGDRDGGQTGGFGAYGIARDRAAEVAGDMQSRQLPVGSVDIRI
ncbi:flagellar hook-length control protein FliK [Alloyangia pacifica]|uniref:Hook-length control protein FliK n=1 Tax=Alloyangia pacifica TaxID=311180 RepID=A0A1I6T0R7_9RHOB|nr:flagellar hook-length control protein FliK [Alloyangia pacifica]SDG93277.1 hook-length control protein FliK [Alloyangia pacifica]SFS82716.1 hook-length control protein FliK [Alloyangia pacifica]